MRGTQVQFNNLGRRKNHYLLAAAASIHKHMHGHRLRAAEGFISNFQASSWETLSLVQKPLNPLESVSLKYLHGQRWHGAGMLVMVFFLNLSVGYLSICLWKPLSCMQWGHFSVYMLLYINAILKHTQKDLSGSAVKYLPAFSHLFHWTRKVRLLWYWKTIKANHR